ncbi:hypothetical protein [Oscillibacter sp.]|uniref:hypothetical protein n=1 Tax=Oscillibacter sp. TaxID=1945593 RepID=UPI0028A06C18|nr:hypothetical protein [Oscillibacter sp.]
MARRQREPIRVEAFVTVNEQKVNIDTLSKEKRCEIGAVLKVTYLNALFRGKAVFHIDEEN